VNFEKKKDVTHREVENILFNVPMCTEELTSTSQVPYRGAYNRVTDSIAF